MQPIRYSITSLFNERQQYLIPLFQRGYVWTLTDQVMPLWADITDRFEALEQHREDVAKLGGQAAKLKPLRKHFLGAVVLGAATDSGSDGVPAREVIDGQQRITTLQIMLRAFWDATRELNDEGLTDDLRPLTRNSGSFSQKHFQMKVWPTQVGRQTLQLLFNAGGLAAACEAFPVMDDGKRRIERPPMVQAYLYFYLMIALLLRGKRFDDDSGKQWRDKPQTLSEAAARAIDKDGSIKLLEEVGGKVILERAQTLHSALRDLFQVMALKLDDAEDDPQIIFETLNARGVPLQPSDLIRNYLFLEAARQGLDVDDLYERHWRDYDEKVDERGTTKNNKFWQRQERQGRLTHTRLDLFLYHYLVMKTQRELKLAHVFDEFKDWWEQSPRDLEQELQQMQAAAKHFERLISPAGSDDVDRFARNMRLLDTATLLPLVLYFLCDPACGPKEIKQVLRDLESYVVRRFICGFTTKSYNKTFIGRVLRDVAESKVATPEHLRRLLADLSGESQHWPSDGEVERAWIHRRLYHGASTAKVRAILETLERRQMGKNQEYDNLKDGLTVEHVMPQTWKSHWPMAADTSEMRERRDRLVHSIGNLTLVTGTFNPKLSNRPFSEKQPEIQSTSVLWLNKHFVELGKDAIWDEEAIVARASELLPLALKAWPREVPE